MIVVELWRFIQLYTITLHLKILVSSLMVYIPMAKQPEATWWHCSHPRTRRSELQDAPRAHSVTPAEDQRVLAREAAGFGPEVAPICSNSAGNLDYGGDGVVGLGLVTGSK